MPETTAQPPPSSSSEPSRRPRRRRCGRRRRRASSRIAQLLGGEFWKRIPAYANVSEAEFLDHKWQAKNSITNIGKLLAALERPGLGRVHRRRAARLRARADVGARVALPAVAHRLGATPSTIRCACSSSRSASRLLPDHPRSDLDSLHERADMPVPGLTHRYVDKALFLALDTCPVYCRFCTRSYAVGIDTEEVSKFQLKVNVDRWQQAFDYIRVAARARGHRDLGRRRVSAARPSRSRRSARRCCRSITSGACATRPRGRR